MTENIGVIPYYGLAAGFLTGKYRRHADLSQSVRGSGMHEWLDGKGAEVLAALDEVAAQTGSVPAQVALAWLMAQPGVTAPIASATRPEQLVELMPAMRLRLSKAQLDRLDASGA